MDTMEPMLFYYHLSAVNEFKELLERKEGAEASVLEKKTSKSYTVVTYDKCLLRDVSTLGLFRSVILNSLNKVVCFSPPKSVSAETFIKAFPELNYNQLITEEFVEGTMMNVFWDPSIGFAGAWEIATKHVVGAETKFFQEYATERKTKSLGADGKTFREMFMEAAHLANLHIDYLDKRLCYSFVLQHPENRIVAPFLYPSLVLVASYEIVQALDDIKVSPIRMDLLSQMDFWKSTRVRFPQNYTGFASYSALIDAYASMNTPYHVMGVVIKNNATGERCKIRNPNYEQVRALRGNQPKLQYRYLSLRKEGKVAEYLKYYPEHKADFSGFRDHLHLYTTTLHRNYLACFVKKEKTKVEDYPEEYQKHMKHLHYHWLTVLREKKESVTKSVVIQYLHELHPSQLMYALNYNMVRRGVDYREVYI